MKLTKENLRACFTEDLRIDYTPPRGGCEETGWTIFAFYLHKDGRRTFGQGFVDNLESFIEDTFREGEPDLVDLKIFKDAESFKFDSEAQNE